MTRAASAKRAPGRLVKVALIGVCGWFAYLIAIAGISAHVSKSNPELALAIRADYAPALIQLAGGEVHRGATGRAQGLSRLALRSDPANAGAYRILGLAYAAGGDVEAADRLLSFASGRTRRDGVVQAWLFERRLQRREFGAAFRHADAIMRRTYNSRPAMFNSIDDVIGLPGAPEALAKRLAISPPWRREYVLQLVGDSRQLPAAGILFSSMRGIGAAPNAEELAVYLMTLVQTGEYTVAQREWFQSKGAHAAPEGTLNNGNFAQKMGLSPFEWLDEQSGTADVEIATPPERDGLALHAEYDGFSEPGFVRQLVVLPPGTHQLTGEVLLDSTDSAGRLSWTITCAGSSRVLGRAPAKGGVQLWVAFTLTFDVPPESCGAQWIELRPDPTDRREGVSIWYDNLSIRNAASLGSG